MAHTREKAQSHTGATPTWARGPKVRAVAKTKRQFTRGKSVELEPAQVLSQNKGLHNTVEQLREANKKLKQAAAEQKVGQSAPPHKLAATPPATVDKKVVWKCQSCGLDHHSGG